MVEPAGPGNGVGGGALCDRSAEGHPRRRVVSTWASGRLDDARAGSVEDVALLRSRDEREPVTRSGRREAPHVPAGLVAEPSVWHDDLQLGRACRRTGDRLGVAHPRPRFEIDHLTHRNHIAATTEEREEDGVTMSVRGSDDPCDVPPLD